MTATHLAVRPPLDTVLAAQPLDDGRGHTHHLADFFDGVLEVALQVSQGHPFAEASLGSLVLQPGDILVLFVILLYSIPSRRRGRGAVDGLYGCRCRPDRRLVRVVLLLKVELHLMVLHGSARSSSSVRRWQGRRDWRRCGHLLEEDVCVL